jgi:hypothetical protein
VAVRRERHDVWQAHYGESLPMSGAEAGQALSNEVVGAATPAGSSIGKSLARAGSGGERFFGGGRQHG